MARILNRIKGLENESKLFSVEDETNRKRMRMSGNTGTLNRFERNARLCLDQKDRIIAALKSCENASHIMEDIKSRVEDPFKKYNEIKTEKDISQVNLFNSLVESMDNEILAGEYKSMIRSWNRIL